MPPLEHETKPSEVSVVIPFYNRSIFLERLLNSIKKQTIQPKHIYIIDNGSHLEEIRKCTEIIKKTNIETELTLVSTQKKGNANYARNLGMELARTKYVAFLDSDDWWESRHLEDSIEELSKTDKAAIYGGAIIHGRPKITKKSSNIENYQSPFEFLFSNHNNIAQTSSYIVDKSKTKNITWDENLKRHQDYDFFASIHYHTNGWAFLRTPTSNIDWQEGGTKKLDYKSMVKFLLKWHVRFEKNTMKKYLYNQILICQTTNAPTQYKNYYRRKFIETSEITLIPKIITSTPYLKARQLAANAVKILGSVRKV